MIGRVTQTGVVLEKFRAAGFEKTADVARALDWPRHKLMTAIDVGYFQHRDHEHVLRKARELGVDVCPDDFIVHLTAAAVV